jgi:WD40 repeat protein
LDVWDLDHNCHLTLQATGCDIVVADRIVGLYRDWITVREVTTGLVIKSVRCKSSPWYGYWDEIEALTVLDGGRHLIVASRNVEINYPSVDVVDIETGRILHEEHSQLNSLLPNGLALLEPRHHDEWQVWDLQRGELLRRQANDGLDYCASALLQNGARAVIGDIGGTITIWDLERADTPRVYRAHSSQISGLATIGNGRNFISVSGDGMAKLWDTETGAMIAGVNVGTLLTCCCCCADGKTVLVGDDQGRLHIFRVEATEG